MEGMSAGSHSQSLRGRRRVKGLLLLSPDPQAWSALCGRALTLTRTQIIFYPPIYIYRKTQREFVNLTAHLHPQTSQLFARLPARPKWLLEKRILFTKTWMWVVHWVPVRLSRPVMAIVRILNSSSPAV